MPFPPRYLGLLLAALLPSCSMLKKDDKVFITVHSEGSDMDPPKTIFTKPLGGRTVIFKILPEFTQKSIVAFHPFEAQDGTYGVALKLDFKGSNHLEIVTRLRKGEILLSMVNGTVVDYVTIDKTVSDGLFTIWRGLPEELIAVMDEQYPRIQEINASSSVSSSESMDMVPSTAKEKKDARRRAEKEAEAKAKAEKDAAKRRARGEYEEIAPLPDGAPVPLGEALRNQ